MRYHLLIAAVAALVAGPALAADPPRDAGLDVVPPGAFAFVTIRVSDIDSVDALKPIKEAIARIEKMEHPIDTVVGVSVAEMDRVTLIWPALPGDDGMAVPLVVVTTRAPFNEAKVLKALRAMPAADGMRRGHRSVEYGAGMRKPTAAKSAVPKVAPDFPGGPPGAIAPVPGGFPPGAAPPGPGGLPGPTPVGPGRLPRPGGSPAPISPGPGGLPAPGTLPPGPPKRFQPIAYGGDDPPKPARNDKPVADKDSGPTGGPDLYLLDGPFAAVFLLDDRTLVFLPPPDRGGFGTYFSLVGQLLRRKADGPLADAIAEAGKHTVTAAVRVNQLEGLVRDEMPKEVVPFRSLLRAQVAVLTVDAGAKTTATARLTFADAAQARRAAPVLSTLIQLGTETLADLRKQADKETDWGPVAIPLIDLASAALDKADVKADGSVVTARVEAEIGPAVAKALAAFPATIEAASTKMKTMNNLKQIGLAMHNYHDVNGHFPTDVIGPTGKPILSWRVQILPYIEQDNMYRQLDLTKAWDDPVNAKVLEKMPDVFRVYDRDAKDKNATYLQTPTMPGIPNGITPFHVPGRRLRIHDITDGSSNSIMVVEAADAVPWAKPGDLAFDPTKAPKVGSPDRKWFFAGFADGSVRTLNRSKLTDEQLRALITINGGEVVEIRD